MRPSRPALPALPVRAARRGGRGLVQVLRQQEQTARLAIAAFLWAMVLGPALHLIDHRADHVHVAGGTHPHGSPGHAHDHGDGDQHGDQKGDGDGHGDGDGVGLPPASPGPPHGDGHALHFGLALLEGLTSVALPAPHALDERVPPGLVSRLRPRLRAAAHCPRGPPPSPAPLSERV